MTNFVHRVVTSRVHPLVYVLMFLSSFIGFCFMTGLIIGTDESVLYGSGVLIDRTVWGALLHFSATAGIVGLFFNKKFVISQAGVFGFMLWLFASISLAMEGFWYILVTVSLLHTTFHTYLVLANALGFLHRTPDA